MRFFIKYSLLFFHLAIILLLCISRFIPTFNPAEFHWMGILGLFVPILAFINLLFFIIWLFTKKYLYCIISIFAFAMAWNVLEVSWGINYFKSNSMEKSTQSFSLMSFNVRLMDLYDWTKIKGNKNNMIAFFKEKNADILCLQEFYSKDSSGQDNIKFIKEICNYPYHSESNNFVRNNRKWGNIIFSKYPITQTNNLLANKKANNLFQKCTIQIENKTINVLNIHLHSNRFSNQDKNLELGNSIKEMTKNTFQKSKSILKKLLLAYKQRGLEADFARYTVEENENLTTLVCGDLNDIPSSYSYFNVKGNLNDAFLEKGKGLGGTYHSALPLIRIDYIFYSKNINVLGWEKFSEKFSDHLPIMCNFSY